MYILFLSINLIIIYALKKKKKKKKKKNQKIYFHIKNKYKE